METDRTPQQRAKHLLDDAEHMTVATTDPSGTPWVSPIFFMPDPERYDLYWTSWREARHSENIRNNPNVAIVVYETQPGTDAVYIKAEAIELTDPSEIEHGIEVMTRRAQPDRWTISDICDVAGEGSWRIYRASPQTVEVRADAEAGGLPIVTRQPADF